MKISVYPPGDAFFLLLVYDAIEQQKQLLSRDLFTKELLKTHNVISAIKHRLKSN